MLPTLEIVGSAFLLDPHDALFGPGGPVVSVNQAQTVSVPSKTGLSPCGSRHGKWLLSWQQKLGSVLMVLILSSLFACEESQLTRSEIEIDILSTTHSFSWRKFKVNVTWKYLP